MLGLELKEPRAFRESKAEGIEQERKVAIEALIIARFGTIDEELAAIVPKLMDLESGEYAGLLLKLSRSELLALSQKNKESKQSSCSCLAGAVTGMS
jgi:hypothetical protein